MKRLGQLLFKWRKAACLVSAALVFISACAWIPTLGVSQEKTVTSTIATVNHNVTLDYAVALRKSLLYPSGMSVGPEAKQIVAVLASRADVGLVDRIAASGVKIEAGHYWVDATVHAGDLWSKAYPLTAPRAIDPAATEIAADVVLPLESIVTDIDAIEDQIRTGSPTGQYEIDVEMHVSLTLEGQPALDHEYTAAFPFLLSSGRTILQGPDELLQTKQYVATSAALQPVTGRFIGFTAPVGVLRIAGGAGVAVFGLILLGSAAMVVRSRPSVRRVPDRRYRDRIVSAASLSGLATTLTVRVATLRGLIRIADDAQVPVMSLGPSATCPELPGLDQMPTPDLQGSKYFVTLGTTLYYVF